MKKVVIVGCGWLGQQLGSLLADVGYEVYGTRQSETGLAMLPSNIRPIQLALPAPPTEAMVSLLSNAWLICAVPPATHRQTSEQYLAALTSLQEMSHTVEGCIHFSSTGIYQGLSGVVDEQSELTNEPRVQLLLKAEQVIQKIPRTTTLRLAGLVGPGRHPAYFGRKQPLAGPELPINMVHATDVCRFVLRLLQNPQLSWPSLLNLCSPAHPQKYEFYTAAAERAGLPPPQFVSADQPARTVSSERSMCDGWRYQYSSPMDMINL